MFILVVRSRRRSRQPPSHKKSTIIAPVELFYKSVILCVFFVANTYVISSTYCHENENQKRNDGFAAGFHQGGIRALVSAVVGGW